MSIFAVCYKAGHIHSVYSSWVAAERSMNDLTGAHCGYYEIQEWPVWDDPRVRSSDTSSAGLSGNKITSAGRYPAFRP